MTFSDDDLKRCKRLLGGEMSMQKIVLNNPEIGALLARLEAAEQYMNWAEGRLLQLGQDDTRIERLSLLQAWRKVSGK